jgi:perosamine synthetase
MIPISRPQLGPEEAQAVAKVLASGHLATGPVVKQFEQEFAQYTGAKHGVAMANGTVAIQAALEAVGVGPGDEVVVPAFTFIATANAVLYVGATPVFADVEEATFNVTAATVEAAAGPRTKAVIAVHLFGHPAPMAELEALCKRRGWKLIGDGAQAHGAAIGTRRVGQWGDVETWSFYPTKNLACPEGGMVTTSHQDVADLARSVANHGRADAGLGVYDHLRRGSNFRLSDVHAAIGLEQLRKLNGFNAARQANAAKYAKAFAGLKRIRPPMVVAGATHAWHQYTLKCEHRDAVQAHLKAAGVGTGIYYPKALHQYGHLKGFAQAPLPVSERLAKQVLSIPVHAGLSAADAEAVIVAVTAADRL